MTKAVKLSGIGLAGLAVALLLSAQTAHAETEILESTTSELKVGAKLNDDASIKLPEGTTVRVMITSPNGTVTKTLKGPYEGRVADYKTERSLWDRLTGKNKEEEMPMGTTRGLKAPQ